MLTIDQIEDFETLSKLMIDWLNNNDCQLRTVLITYNSAELLSSEIAFSTESQNLVDIDADELEELKKHSKILNKILAQNPGYIEYVHIEQSEDAMEEENQEVKKIFDTMWDSEKKEEP